MHPCPAAESRATPAFGRATTPQQPSPGKSAVALRYPAVAILAGLPAKSAHKFVQNLVHQKF